MPVAIGDRLGPYEIVDVLGAGGMGEVYRATDARLRRDVAIKIARAQFSDRSMREARMVAALNHSNICHIYDVGTNYLVMELIDGPTLADRLKQGPVPVKEALEIARQIGEALEAAHEKGIVHRDLKPGNIKIRPDGTVKVLDFGLAKIVEDNSPGDNLTTVTLENSTRAGAVVGTVAYMAPEQARGKAVDKRADIWAFGVVLYEMLCGRRPFPGETVSDTLAAVLTKEPEWDCIPVRAVRLVRRCLEKDPQQRLRDIGDARYLLEDRQPAVAAQPGSALPWKIAAGALAVVLAAGAVWAFRFARQKTTPAVLRLSVDFGGDATLAAYRAAPMALSPDGSRIVFITGYQTANQRLAVRRLDQPNNMSLPGTEGAEGPFFSPDGKSVGFFADGKLKKTDVEGGTPVTLCDAPRPRGGSWGDDGNIVFAPTNQGGLSRVPSSGGVPQPVTQSERTRGDDSQRYPQVLPGAESVLFMAGLDPKGEGSIDLESFKTGKRKTLIESGAYSRYLPSGHLVYMHRNTLFAAPMDAARLELTGPSAPVLEDVSFRVGTGTAAFTFSQSGIFVYTARNAEDRMKAVTILDDRGQSELLPLPKADYSNPRASPMVRVWQ
jgi:serine/threonine-protein kinase